MMMIGAAQVVGAAAVMMMTIAVVQVVEVRIITMIEKEMNMDGLSQDKYSLVYK